jgi:hypothetical protein
VLIRCYKELPAINCVQHKAEKKTITQQDIVQSNFNGFGNSVGSITNRATAMFSVQAQFEKHSKEYKELEYRILCTQLYQQNEIDKIKGIVAKPMAKYWYSYKDCPNEYQKSICCEKKPYFMIYRYDKEKTEYRKFIKDNNAQCIADYGIDIKTLLTLPYNQLTEEQKNTVKWYNKFNPVDMNLCTINRICFYIESVIKEYKSTFKERKIDYTQFKVKRRCTQKHKEELKYLMGIYISHNQTYQIQDKIDTNLATKPMLNFVENYIIDRAKEMCSNDDERWNIILDMCNEVKDIEQKDYCWIILVDILTRREENSGKIDI